MHTNLLLLSREVLSERASVDYQHACRFSVMTEVLDISKCGVEIGPKKSDATLCVLRHSFLSKSRS
ncbi:MAG TPA: hypothetical protein VNW73_12900, partial [Ktedonobacteraceae bacterium]|nr:hypothetical protein [Ktedonobacteraceae bacterium]